MEKHTRKLNADAGRLQCQFSADTNGNGAKTAKFSIVARTPNVLEVYGWSTDDNPNGRIAHDLSGMRTKKPEIPILYNHSSMPIGVANRIELKDGNLVLSGIIKSTAQDDLADSIITKLRAGLPFQASINFGDSGMEVEEYGEGELAACNGTVYSGPLTVIRRWTLVEVSICAIGQDTSTDVKIDLPETIPDTQSAPTPSQDAPAVYSFSATVRERSIRKDYDKLAKDVDIVTSAKDIEIPKTDNQHKTVFENRNISGSGASITEGSRSGSEDGSGEKGSDKERVQVLSGETKPEPDTVEPTGVDAVESVEGKEKQLSANALSKYSKEWGYENTVKWLCEENLSVEQAEKRYYQTLREENEKLKQFAKQQSATVDFIPSDDPGKVHEQKINELVGKGMSRGQAEYVARSRK